MNNEEKKEVTQPQEEPKEEVTASEEKEETEESKEEVSASEEKEETEESKEEMTVSEEKEETEESMEEEAVSEEEPQEELKEEKNEKGININESLHEIEEKVKKSDVYAQLKDMFTKIKNRDFAFELPKKHIIIMLVMIGAIIIFDQLTKIISSNLFMVNESYEIIDNFFYFTYVKNFGMAWSAFEGARWAFVLLTPIILLFVTYFFVYSKKHEVLTRGGMILIFAGAIGNWIDRLLLGYVRDFIHFIIPIINYDFPVFNIADIAVVMGMMLVIVEIIIQEYQIWKLSKSL